MAGFKQVQKGESGLCKWVVPGYGDKLEGEVTSICRGLVFPKSIIPRHVRMVSSVP